VIVLIPLGPYQLWTGWCAQQSPSFAGGLMQLTTVLASSRGGLRVAVGAGAARRAHSVLVGVVFWCCMCAPCSEYCAPCPAYFEQLLCVVPKVAKIFFVSMRVVFCLIFSCGHGRRRQGTSSGRPPSLLPCERTWGRR